MSNHQFNDRRPTPLEDQAHAEMMREFSEHFSQFPQARSAVQNLEKNTRRLAQEADQDVRREAQNHFQGDDGNQWCMGPELEEKVNMSHRSTAEGIEFAVIERLDMKSG